MTINLDGLSEEQKKTIFRTFKKLIRFLRSKFETLNYFDAGNIARLVIKNQLPFEVADKTASLLFKMKNVRFHNDIKTAYSTTFKKAELAAAAELACEQLKLHVKMNFDTDISLDEIRKYKDEFSLIND
ncbi:MAG: hypothetical protein ACFE9N_11180 [Promethearchaeota archaeon]